MCFISHLITLWQIFINLSFIWEKTKRNSFCNLIASTVTHGCERLMQRKRVVIYRQSPTLFILCLKPFLVLYYKYSNFWTHNFLTLTSTYYQAISDTVPATEEWLLDSPSNTNTNSTPLLLHHMHPPHKPTPDQLHSPD